MREGRRYHRALRIFDGPLIALSFAKEKKIDFNRPYHCGYRSRKNSEFAFFVDESYLGDICRDEHDTSCSMARWLNGDLNCDLTSRRVTVVCFDSRISRSKIWNVSFAMENEGSTSTAKSFTEKHAERMKRLRELHSKRVSNAEGTSMERVLVN